MMQKLFIYVFIYFLSSSMNAVMKNADWEFLTCGCKKLIFAGC